MACFRGPIGSRGTDATAFTSLRERDTLDGGPVLPGFTLPLATLFGELDRHG